MVIVAKSDKTSVDEMICRMDWIASILELKWEPNFDQKKKEWEPNHNGFMNSLN